MQQDTAIFFSRYVELLFVLGEAAPPHHYNAVLDDGTIRAIIYKKALATANLVKYVCGCGLSKGAQPVLRQASLSVSACQHPPGRASPS